MNRSEFLRRTACAACATAVIGSNRLGAAESDDVAAVQKQLEQTAGENTFTNNWLSDLFDAIDAEVDRPTQERLLEACGRGCYRRHKFKQDIAAEGSGDLDRLLAAYRKNFNIERVGDDVHIRYGGGKCFCPAAKHRAPRANDVQCECTKATHQMIFETALGRKFRGEIVESVRRGGSNCHIVIHLA
ncbi:MAG TPA: hypothetical protein VK178_17940 [Opitutaceae bacterium]|nr:hypothetical protein [Opitutaceae bacterium]